MAIGLLAMLVSVVGIWGLLAERRAVTTIWVAARDIESEGPLSAEDLTTASVAGSVGFEHYATDEVSLESVLAAVPRADIAAGTPLGAGQFYDGTAPAALDAGSLTVAVVLGEAHVPANLGRGDQVLLVGVPDSIRSDAVAGSWPGTSPVSQVATVVAVSDSATSSEVTVTVAVPRDVVDDVAWLAGQKRLVIARDR
ncbi:MAG: hypothetical protein ACFCVK_20450 [Acidimicrobiales bacterium]